MTPTLVAGVAPLDCLFLRLLGRQRLFLAWRKLSFGLGDHIAVCLGEVQSLKIQSTWCVLIIYYFVTHQFLAVEQEALLCRDRLRSALDRLERNKCLSSACQR